MILSTPFGLRTWPLRRLAIFIGQDAGVFRQP